METSIDKKTGAIFCKKRPGLLPGSISTASGGDVPPEAFLAAANIKASHFDGDKESFLGRSGSLAAPEAVVRGTLKDRDGKWNDAVAASQVDLTLKPGEAKTIIFLIGSCPREDAAKLIQKYSDLTAVEKALEDVKVFWNGIIEDCFIETPDKALNIMTNIWLKYQAIAGRLWGKTGYYQCSGAFGFRDQLQDSQLFLSLDPKLTKRQILLHAEQQYSDGTVKHWWHPNTNIFSHAHMTDNLLWMVFVSLNYMEETGDASLFDLEIPYIVEKDGSQEKGSLYNHCVRAIERVFARWSHRGLPLIGEGDWNDGLSHVGIRWKGESIWLGQFLYSILQRFVPLAEKRGDTERAQNYKKRAEELKKAINEHAWE
jgi:cellobiose phosphorylase